MNPANTATDRFYIVKSVIKKTSAKGDPYLDLMLTDANGEISSKVWDFKESAHGWIAPNMIVKVRGNEEIWNEKKQFRLQRIRHIAPDDHIVMSDLVPCAPYESSALFEEIDHIVDTFENTELQALVRYLYNAYKEKILVCPAAVRLHHAICGGLLYHTLSVVRLAQSVCTIYPFVDRDLLLAGAILHDLAKTTELDVGEAGIASGYTVDGTLLGHLVMGALEVEKAAQALGTSHETAVLLQHLLLSHHGVPEFGCAVRPMCLEAELLSMLDHLDATVNQIAGATAHVEQGKFSEKLWALDQRRFYQHRPPQEGRTELGLPLRQESQEEKNTSFLEGPQN